MKSQPHPRPDPRIPVLTVYARISDPKQKKGGGLERQTEADVAAFAERFGFVVSKRILVDDGVSAWKGLNASPEHALGQFLEEARKGLVLPGDCLALENMDRLSRQDPWAAIGLVNDLRQLGIHIGRLDRMKLLRSDSTDLGDFFEMSVEFARGNSESNAKSFRNLDHWRKKREKAKAGNRPLTRRLPGWIRLVDAVVVDGKLLSGRLVLIPERAAVVRRIFHLAAEGYGSVRIAQLLNREGVPAFGQREPVLDEDGKPVLLTKGKRKGNPRHRVGSGGYLGSGKWTRAYVARLLQDRRVLGELQPKYQNGTPAGDVIENYYEAAITEAEWGAARAVLTPKKESLDCLGRRKGGRVGKYVELFSGLLRDALSQTTYRVACGMGRSGDRRVLLPAKAVEGNGGGRSFPLRTFERAVLSVLREVDPGEVLPGNGRHTKVADLSARLNALEAAIARIAKDLDEHGESETLYRRLREKEAAKREVATQLATARAEETNPVSQAWGQTKTLIDLLDGCGTDDERLALRSRLRAVIQRIVASVWLLVLPRGRDRLCAVQIWFAGGERHRSYIVLHRPPKANARSRQEGGWWACSLADVAGPGDLDLRQRSDAAKLEKLLATVDLEVLAADMKGLPR